MTDVSRETDGRLTQYLSLVRRWNPTVNLVSRGDLSSLEERHAADSVRCVEVAPSDMRCWVDLGSGGGFPGIVAAIHRPDATHHLVESDRRKAAFLRTVIRELQLSATVHAERIESCRLSAADVVSARALASLDQLLGYARPILRPGGVMLFPKGETWRSEVDVARDRWQFDHVAHPSATRPGAVVLEVRNVQPA